MAGKLQGIFTPTLVPLDARGEINESELRRFLAWLIEKGVHGLYPNGSTGEFTRLSLEERRRIVKISCEVAQGKVPVLAGAAEANVRDTLAACEAYAGYGAVAVAIVSPFYYRLSPDSVYAYFAEIAKHSPIDVTLYNIPMFASPIDVRTIQRLAADCPRIIGIKDSTGDLSFMMRMIAAVRPIRPDFTFLTGWDVVLTPMMLAGCDGGTNASSNVVPELMRQVYDLTKAGHYQQAMQLHTRILELFDAMLLPFEFPDGFRCGAAMRGFDFGRGRQPMTAAQQVDRAALEKVLRCILSDCGVVDPPASGCAPRGGSVQQDRIAQLALEIVGELEQRGVICTKR
ncbi:MAG: dihydrodipicolinate synthase family protein [Acidobacteria bacterium]|nr:dihydrodipicolinate synthase family protein [Acidobacteriota bacterium]